MEKPSSRRWSSGAVVEAGGHEEKLPLRGGLELHAHGHAGEQQEAGRGRHRRSCVRAGLVLCLLTLPAIVLLLQRWRTSSSPDWVFDVDPPMEDDDDQGTDSSAHPATRTRAYVLVIPIERDDSNKPHIDRDKRQVKQEMI
jgi:xyloglucan fucosyltransferase